jgi:hypothetical protein
MTEDKNEAYQLRMKTFETDPSTGLPWTAESLATFEGPSVAEMAEWTLEEQWMGLSPLKRQQLVGADQKSLMFWKSWDVLSAQEKALLKSLYEGKT